MQIKFTKMHGLGNDFMVVDGVNQSISLSSDRIRALADRHYGIGFDQLLIVEKPQSAEADFLYRIFNADGSEVNQCGNGARCFARFVRDTGLSDKNPIVVDTNSGQLKLHIDDDGHITVNMGIPKHSPDDIPMRADAESTVYNMMLEGIEYSFGSVSIGNPHAVLEIDSIERAPVETIGPLIEKSFQFPERVNVGFMQIVDKHSIKLRVYERGTGETLACGSGACAATVIGIEQNILKNPVRVQLRGGQLVINWEGRGEPVYLCGPADTVFEGTIQI